MAFTAVAGISCFLFLQNADKQAPPGREGSSLLKGSIVENFTKSIEPEPGLSFGEENQLTFELFRNGTFEIPGDGIALQKSGSYRDSAWIRSTEALPPTYKVSVVVGEINYSLENIFGLKNDPEYPEGPKNENGCYLIAITDEAPVGHHTNIWWHQHRKVVIDIDNNIWGHGMPSPIFMVYFDEDNKLVSFDGASNQWQREWKKALEYREDEWYKIDIEKTREKYILAISDKNGKLLKKSEVPISQIWHGSEDYPDYFVVGDPHENYYQGSMKIKSISLAF